jgi:hypothetical protein
VDFSTPAAGEEIIPAAQTLADLAVPLLDSGLFDAYKYFSIRPAVR